MAFSTGGGGGAMGEINVTPMIDILLVLLIIFMVIVPVTPKGLDALSSTLPRTRNSSNSRTIAPSLFRFFIGPGPAPAYKINDTDVNHADLLAKLTDIYANRAERVMFV